jgi:nucleotide-binding universal stress UspA family protein
MPAWPRAVCPELATSGRLNSIRFRIHFGFVSHVLAERIVRKQFDESNEAPTGSAFEATPVSRSAAHLVVVGTRGRGTMKSLFLGSVTEHVVTHCSAPIVVVPPPKCLRADLAE